MDKFQKDFLKSILTPDDLPAEFLAQIKPVGSLTPENVINVYRGDYYARLQEALGKNYEATWLLMGDEDFHTTGQAFIRQHPSTLRNLTTYGEAFPDFLNQHELDDFIVDMARFEKNFWKIFHLAPRIASPLTEDDIHHKNFDLTHVYLSHSALKLHDLWLKREATDDGLSLDDFEGEEWLAVYRSEDKVEVKKISEIQYQILNLIKDVKNLNQAFGRLEEMQITTAQEDWPLIFSILSNS